MFQLINLFYCVLIHLTVATPHINLYYTNWTNNNDNNGSQHDCLRVLTLIKESQDHHQIVLYCIDELPSDFHIEKKNVLFEKFTFDELSKQRITSQQLYDWSTPMDIIEDYQSYLNQLSTSSSLATRVFYNCTLPRFGSMCQYELYNYHENYSSLYEIIYDFYHKREYNPEIVTCYTHLECYRGPYPSCLDWSEICNGKVDCLDGEFDEEHCWQLEMNTCQDNEFQCPNGQCILKSFIQDNINDSYCLDEVDDYYRLSLGLTLCEKTEPSFNCDDIRRNDKFLTSSYFSQRESILLRAMFSVKYISISDDCWFSFICKIYWDLLGASICQNYCFDDECNEVIERECPDMMFIPAIPVLFGQIYFAYRKNHSKTSNNLDNSDFGYPYVCYNNSIYDNYFINSSKVYFNNTICYYRQNRLFLYHSTHGWDKQYLLPYYRDLWEYHYMSKYNQSSNYISRMCNNSDIYRCNNSIQCISMSKIMDNIIDCPNGDDENILYVSHIILPDQVTSAFYAYPENIKVMFRYVRKHILFQTICDGFVELAPILIGEQNHTDETECEQWQCNNIYTHCDGLWNCLNGADEIGCNSFSLLNCSPNDHICVSPHTNKFMCLPITKANDGNIDCIGGSDETLLCQRMLYVLYNRNNFHCIKGNSGYCIPFFYLCDGDQDCIDGSDEQFCEKNRTYQELDVSICQPSVLPFASDIEQFICNRMKIFVKQHLIYFSLGRMDNKIEDKSKNIENNILLNPIMNKISEQVQYNCNRGVVLHVWSNNENNSRRITCLCPPSYYGNKCQYQNERISLTLQIRVLFDSFQIPFSIIILLIDNTDQRIIHSYEQLNYLSIKHCKMKSNIYLTYSTRPKDLKRNYSIHIDIYERISLTYRGSYLFPIYFPFLPVHRLALIVDIPHKDDKNIQTCSNNQCNHGKCIKYLNNAENITFCKCDREWFGKYCNIQQFCQCSNDSLCIGVLPNNRSICICPIDKFGSRCLVPSSICQNSTCQNDGQCIPNDNYMIYNQKFICICSKGFIGDQCETVDNKLILSFEKSIIRSQSIFIHFIEVVKNNIPNRATTFKMISIRQDSIIIYWSQPFHLVFIELFHQNYYLGVHQTIYNQSTTIIKIINPSDHCQHISKLFNESFAKLDLIRRIKYYHLICELYSSNLKCFYDDIHLCLCYDFNQKRLANCFEFDHNMKFNCLEQNVCENDGQCFQDHPNCPHKSICICPLCYYGTRCQFSTSGFDLSLDAILGYHILPNINIIYQPVIIKISLTLTIIFIVIGLIDGVLSMITFKTKTILEVGCGVYLLGSSITTLFIMIIFGLKFCILLLAQITIISNRLFLKIQCISLDFLLRVCLNMDQWLNACVAMERAITVIQATRFNKKKSKQGAKLAIIILLVINIGTSIHDPFYRRLIDEENEDEKRIWCITTYPSGLNTFNSIINTIHFIVPFLINLISAVILILKKSRQQANVQTNQTYIELLRKQFETHKHLLTAPIMLVILALPRLLISFASKCMKSSNDAWIFLIGYLISYIPPMLTFVIYILPSKVYKSQFHKNVAEYRTNIQRYLNITVRR